VHTFRFPMHAKTPRRAESDKHLTNLDALIGEAAREAQQACRAQEVIWLIAAAGPSGSCMRSFTTARA
jgi:hypothetical protein